MFYYQKYWNGIVLILPVNAVESIENTAHIEKIAALHADSQCYENFYHKGSVQ